MNDTQAVVRAIENTKKFFPDVWKNLLVHRLPSKDSAGVYFHFKTEKELEKALLAISWKRGASPLIGDGDEIFTAPLPGLMAFEEVDKLPDSVLMSPEICKDTGRATLVVRSICRNVAIETYLITGVKEGKRVVLDFQPGEPVAVTKVNLAKISSKKYINKKLAHELGFKWVRLV